MKVSIVTVVYNNENTIEHCIKSVLSQNYDNFEYILIDGCSSDNTMNIIDKYKENIDIIISEIDNGIYDAMNKGLRISTGDVIGFLNSDDIFYSENIISNIVDQFKNNDIDCCYGNLIFKNINGSISRNWISKDFYSGLFQRSWTPAHPTFYCKKEMYDKYGFYRTDYKIAADVDLMFRFLDIHGINSKFIDQYFVIMSDGGVSNRGIKSTFTITKEVRNSFIENKQPFNLLVYLIYKFIKIIRQKNESTNNRV
ncbi:MULTISPECIES: glycosyltransferase family 2 protein [unclassified Oceanispirochaeta]|uniref:glycosyltransferase family 2 protein n=1 Tax=unclassified Oceanispirochaeta TaxID=2635722 RepID=UPI000E091245|nr:MULTISPECIES: glycosyltransferase family 2 protein [unclassified Oceanispirochaeta]MBF9017752.1 glycosyltransferase [Oceanispirochaeta sp. M2]NPD74316.1 glycosyltransferase [Oceanispirochaeta sp. M1]RDG29797.1 glycosyltransferase [Oceanispirochaeta sp. M1]